MKNYGQRWVNAVERSESIPEWVPFVAEIATGSRMKYVLDKRSGQLMLHRALASQPVARKVGREVTSDAGGLDQELARLS